MAVDMVGTLNKDGHDLNGVKARVVSADLTARFVDQVGEQLALWELIQEPVRTPRGLVLLTTDGILSIVECVDCNQNSIW